MTEWSGIKSTMVPAVGPQPAKSRPLPEKGTPVFQEWKHDKSNTKTRKIEGTQAAKNCENVEEKPADVETNLSNVKPGKKKHVSDLIKTFEEIESAKKKPKCEEISRTPDKIWKRPNNCYGEGLSLYCALLSELKSTVGEEKPSIDIPKCTNDHTPQRKTPNHSFNPLLNDKCKFPPNFLKELENALEERQVKQPLIRRVSFSGTGSLLPRPYQGPYTQLNLGQAFKGYHRKYSHQ